MEGIENMLAQKPKGIRGSIIDNHIILDIVGEDVHYWSPQLNFRIEEDEDDTNHAVVSGLIGPRPGVWTMFVFIYFSIGLIGFFITSYGITEIILGNFSHYIWAFPISILLVLTAYRVSKYGEKLAADQIDMLKQFVRDCISYEKSEPEL